jgi:DNA-binding NarL/FixJ family response regulator
MMTLAAHGLSNDQIAERLFLSAHRSTVKPLARQAALPAQQADREVCFEDRSVPLVARA